jgi:tetratricopeptide (TPR) repeat protein
MSRMPRTLAFGLMALALGSGCSSLRYEKSEDLWAQGDDKFKNGQFADSIPYYDELLRRDDNDTKARLKRGIARDRSGDTSDALTDYGTLADAGDGRALLFRAQMEVRDGLYDQAEKDLAGLRGMSLNEHQEVIQYGLVGELRLKQGKARMAIQSLEKAIELGSSSADSDTLIHVRQAHYNAGEAYFQMGQYQSATEHLEAYKDLADKTGGDVDGHTYYKLCIVHYMSGDLEGARAYLSKADPVSLKKAGDTFQDPDFFGSGSVEAAEAAPSRPAPRAQ